MMGFTKRVSMRLGWKKSVSTIDPKEKNSVTDQKGSKEKKKSFDSLVRIKGKDVTLDKEPSKAPQESPPIVIKPAPLHPREKERMEELLSFKILDTDPSPNFDEITELASQICEAPVCIINIIDNNRAFLKSGVGTGGIVESPRDISFCAYAILEPEKMTVVEDTLLDDRFCSNPLVVLEPQFRFYAGSPLVTPNGLPLGTLCTFDNKPRTLTPHQKRCLEILSHQVMVQLLIHKQVTMLKEVFEDQITSHKALQEAIRLADEANISSFENLLLSSVGVNAFLAFLQEKGEATPLEFWMATNSYYTSHPKRSQEENLKQAQEICEKYFSSSSSSSSSSSLLPLPSSITSPIQRALSQNEKLSPSLFAEAEKQAMEGLRSGPYEGFKKSPAYRNLLQEIHQMGYQRLYASGQA